MRPVGSWVLESGNVVAQGLAVSLDKPLEWAIGFFFGNVELILELWTVIAGISGFDVEVAYPLVFTNLVLDLEDIMLFHVTANHDHMTCPARAGGRDSDEARQALKWIEGNDDVTVLGVWISGPLHRVFTLLEASDFDAVSALLRDQMLIGKAEVLPVSDAIARRKQGGHWGT